MPSLNLGSKDLRVKCTENVSHDKPLLARRLEVLVLATRLFAYTIKRDGTPDSGVDTLASDLDDLVLVFAQVHHLYVPV